MNTADPLIASIENIEYFTLKAVFKNSSVNFYFLSFLESSSCYFLNMKQLISKVIRTMSRILRSLKSSNVTQLPLQSLQGIVGVDSNDPPFKRWMSNSHRHPLKIFTKYQRERFRCYSINKFLMSLNHKCASHFLRETTIENI